MASRAFALWQTESSARLDELERFHAAAGGSGTGQQWGVEQLTRSMFGALLAQFQTYCRNVHDDAIGVHADEANPRQVEVLRLLLTQGRKLDAGNPRSSALGSDFDRLGFRLIPALRAEGGTVSATLADLDVLVDFRNGVSHGNESELADIVARGSIAATIVSYRHFRERISALVVTLDRVLAKQLGVVLGVAPPW